MKKIFTIAMLSLLTLPMLVAQNNVTIDASAEWKSFMNVFRADGSYWFGDPWSFDNLKSTLDTDANTVTLQPNFNAYADNTTNPEWVDQSTGAGVATMEANSFIEPGASFNGTDLNFSGTIQSFTLSDDYAVTVFIKALDPNNGFADALNGSGTMTLTEAGDFSVSAAGGDLADGLLIQYGFSVTGPNANPADEATLGSVVASDMSVNVNDLNPEIEASVYPNPTAEVLSIRSATPVQAFQVLNFLGQQVITGVGTNDVDVSNLPAGTYSIIVEVEEGKKAMTFVKK